MVLFDGPSFTVILAGRLLIFTWHAQPPEPRRPQPFGRDVALDFTPYRPATLPPSFSERGLHAGDGFGGPVLYSSYSAGRATPPLNALLGARSSGSSTST